MLSRGGNVLDIHKEDSTSQNKLSGVSERKKEARKDSAAQVEEPRKEEDVDEKPVRMINIIFLPFTSWWQAIIVFESLINCILGPLVAIYPFYLCPSTKFEGLFESLLWFSLHIGQILYFVDTFLYILHRQVAEEAMKREFLPKSAALILMDIVSVLPLQSLFSDEICVTEVTFWPNILSFLKLVLLYRIAQYFSLKATHSYKMLMYGYVLMLVVIVNALTCFLLLLYHAGLIAGYESWKDKYEQQVKSQGRVGQHFIAINFITSILLRSQFEQLKIKSYGEFGMIIVLTELSFLSLILYFMPKLFNELKFHHSPIFNFQPRAIRVLEAIKKRSPENYFDVKKFYDLTWKKQNGITSLPHMINLFPRCLRLDVRYDLAWAVFYHSPTFRATSLVFKRWLSEHIELRCSLPGEKFYGGSHSLGNLYYVKSGILQLLSGDDSIAPTVSVSSGTILGDINFYTPQLTRKVFARCFTYCEVFTISRAHILHALDKFPSDKRVVMKRVRRRLEHAHQLYTIKTDLKVQTKSEEAGIVWLKRRWWEISEILLSRKGKSERSFKIPPDETAYHCAKYIGQLVFCPEALLQKKSLFYKVLFPWILAPKSHFTKIWHLIVRITTVLVLIIFPPCLARHYIEEAKWFQGFATTVDFIFIFDIVIPVITAKDEKDDTKASILIKFFDQFKEKRFMLDILSTSFVDNLFSLSMLQDYAILGKFNRVIKTYILFLATYDKEWWKNQMTDVYLRFSLILCWAFYVLPYFVFVLCQASPVYFATSYMFVRCSYVNATNPCPKVKEDGIFMIVMEWLREHSTITPDLYKIEEHRFTNTCFFAAVMVFHMFLFTFLKLTHVVTLHFKHSSAVVYQYYVFGICDFHKKWKMSSILFQRLNNYLDVQYRHNKGIDFLYPDLAKNEPYDVHWKIHGQVAEKVFGESAVFKGADPGLLKELAGKAIFLILPKNSKILSYGVYSDTINWLLNGVVRIEQDVSAHETVVTHMALGQLMAICTIFFNQATLKGYTSETDTEIIYLKRSDFLSIINRYPVEWSIFKSSLNEMAPRFHEMYKKRLQMRHGAKSAGQPTEETKPSEETEISKKKSRFSRIKAKLSKMLYSEYFEEYRTNPESRFITWWSPFRAGVVVVNLIAAALQGGALIQIYKPIEVLKYMCWAQAIIDMIVKTFIPFYDSRGVVISDKRMCAVHYLTRGFVLDLLSVVARLRIVTDSILGTQNPMFNDFVTTIANALPVYLVVGYFSYRADVHMIRVIYSELVKWQILTFLVAITAACYYVKSCYVPAFDDKKQVTSWHYISETCWMPDYFALLEHEKNSTIYHFQLAYAQSISLVQNAYMNCFTGQNHLTANSGREAFIYVSLSAYFCYQYTCCQVFILLHYYANNRNFSGFNRWLTFLREERIEKPIIDKVISTFNYHLMRTMGINKELLYAQASIVFKQDRNYYFMKRSVKAADTVLKGGDALMRQMCGSLSMLYFMPEEDVVRQNQLTDSIYIVHRGKALIFQDDKNIASLTKGCLFGQLQSSVTRPIRITVIAETNCDLLVMPCSMFRQMISHTVSRTIAGIITVQDDYILLDNVQQENPYNTYEYITKAEKTIKIPRFSMQNENDQCYKRWLEWCWVINPILTCGFALPLAVVRTGSTIALLLLIAVFFLDICHFLYLVSEFFSMEFVLVGSKFVYKYVGWKKFKEWTLYLNLLTIIIPIFAIIFLPLEFQIVRVLRIYLVFKYFKLYRKLTDRTPTIFKLLFAILLLHAVTVGWQYVACKYKKYYDKFPVTILKEHKIENRQDSVSVHERTDGCVCLSSTVHKVKLFEGKVERYVRTYYVATDWRWDYFKALVYIVNMQTHFNMNVSFPLTIKEIYYKIFANHMLYLAELWISSMALSYAYIKLREVNQYDYQGSQLVNYLRTNGVCDFLLQSVEKYAGLLWTRQSGSNVPEIVDNMHICLREDVFESLYMYHLLSVKLFSDLPIYFLRQMAVKLKRVLVLPGKYIVQEGDIQPCIYFIHEGEVEKWYTDSHGDTRMGSVLGTSGYFGLLPGLFPMLPFTYSYYSRTIVDIAYLYFEEWQDLMKGYPQIKAQLYKSANALRQHKYNG